MSNWTHRVCAACYAEAEPGRDPIRLREETAVEETAGVQPRCCFCEGPAPEGIYYRANPARCKALENHR